MRPSSISACRSPISMNDAQPSQLEAHDLAEVRFDARHLRDDVVVRHDCDAGEGQAAQVVLQRCHAAAEEVARLFGDGREGVR